MHGDFGYQKPNTRSHLRHRHLRLRDELFLSRQELAVRWAISVREIIKREKHGELKGLAHRFSYKMIRYKLSDIIRVEEKAKVNEQ
jgi:hypothetical protein